MYNRCNQNLCNRSNQNMCNRSNQDRCNNSIRTCVTGLIRTRVTGIIRTGATGPIRTGVTGLMCGMFIDAFEYDLSLNWLYQNTHPPVHRGGGSFFGLADHYFFLLLFVTFSFRTASPKQVADLCREGS